jgi:hypothetical protein
MPSCVDVFVVLTDSTYVSGWRLNTLDWGDCLALKSDIDKVIIAATDRILPIW